MRSVLVNEGESGFRGIDAMNSRIRRLKRKVKQAKGRKGFLGIFSDIFPGCRSVFGQDGDIVTVICLDCGNCLFVDPQRGLFTIGTWIEEKSRAAIEM